MLTIALAALAATPVVHPLAWDSLARFEGWRLAGATVTDFARSEITQGDQLLELTVEGRARWAVRCLSRGTGHRATLACSLTPDGAVQAAHFVSLIGADSQPWQGYQIQPGKVGGPGAGGWAAGDIRAIIGMDAGEVGAADGTARYTYGLKFPDAQGHPTAHYQLGLPPKLTVSEGMPAHAVELLAVTTLAVEIAGDLRPDPAQNGDRVGVFLDGYPLAEAQGATANEGEPQAGRALAAVSAPHSAVLEDFVTRGARMRLDRKAGTRLARHGDFGRPLIEVSAGAISAAGPAGAAPSGLDGFNIQIAGGLRVARRTGVMVTMGIEVGVMDAEALRQTPGVRDATSAALSMGLHLRHTFDLGLGVEPVVGARVRGRLRFVDLLPTLNHPAPSDHSLGRAQFGWAVAPTLALQIPYTFHELDTRLVFFVEGVPEWSMWSTGSREPHMDPRVDALLHAIGSDDFQFTTMLGARFEL